MRGQQFYENLVYYLRSIAVIGMILFSIYFVWLLANAPKGFFLILVELGIMFGLGKWLLTYSAREKARLLAQENQVKLLETFWEFLEEYEIVMGITEKEKEMIFSNFITKHLIKNDS